MYRWGRSRRGGHAWVERPGHPLLRATLSQPVGTTLHQVLRGCPCPAPVSWHTAMLCDGPYGLFSFRLTDAFLRSSCFLPWYCAPEQRGVPAGSCQAVPRFSTGFQYKRPRHSCRLSCHRPVGTPEADFLGPLPGKCAPTSPPPSLKPVLWEYPFLRNVGAHPGCVREGTKTSGAGAVPW